MRKDFSYREGDIRDLLQIQQLAIASYGQYKKILTEENWKQLSQFLDDEKTFVELIKMSHPFVCVTGGAIVGMAFLIASGNPTEIFQHNWSYIRMVGVHPANTGQGIARKLTILCIEKAKSLDEKIIALHTSEFMDAARHLYESIGFTMLKEIPPRFGKRYWLYNLNL